MWSEYGQYFLNTGKLRCERFTLSSSTETILAIANVLYSVPLYELGIKETSLLSHENRRYTRLLFKLNRPKYTVHCSPCLFSSLYVLFILLLLSLRRNRQCESLSTNKIREREREKRDGEKGMERHAE